MAQTSVLINVAPTHSPNMGFMTTIVTVLTAKNLFAIDISKNEALNEALQASDELLFTTTLDGIAVRFKAQSLSAATLNGSAVFAIPIPDSLYWKQQRNSYRAPIPFARPLICIVQLSDSSMQRFPVLNISQTGFSFMDKDKLVKEEVEIGQILRKCRFSRPSAAADPFSDDDDPFSAKDVFSAKICRLTEVSSDGRAQGLIVGLNFAETTRRFDMGIQNYLHELALEKKRKIELTRSDGALTGRFGRD
ncbi:flagellar regulator YcgR PilZN domain-containing protein [Candidatus Methylospira mobilis]|uniref:flagellar brake protein n=1 Tax=Candidatus Methylospira mobilis TaxID=1808979 RepID=UPI0028E53E9E|nr:flagellar regulator YcgR PilZN domain-containing protein [Candidatus Methylospira mobilis]WNV05735.1 flagellar regulator YcgR PilZN domain-containing protein [Candidatus Methylospira mobilis]